MIIYKLFFLTLNLIIFQTITARADCLKTYQTTLKSLTSCMISNPIEMASNPPTGITFWTTTSPFSIGPCIYYVNDYKKTVRLLSEGLQGEGLLFRQISKKYNLEKNQLKQRIDDLNNNSSICDKDNLWSYNEVVEYLVY